jgi:hypothetical protein
MWKIDAYGSVKIKERYFTPQENLINSNSAGILKMSFSLD